MCGIAVIISEKPVHHNIRQMYYSMSRRGPDGGGVKVMRECFMAHRLLSVTGSLRQPFSIKHFSIVFNGEIYNHMSLRGGLKHDFRTKCDTETVLAYFIEKGPVNIDRDFNGQYAFVIWDSKEKEIFVKRDPVGIKQLFEYRDKDYRIIASDVKTILASELVKPEVNYEALYQNFRVKFATHPQTCFKGISAIGGHYIFSPVDGNLEEVLDDAIKIRLPKKKTALFMSGGIDSSLIGIKAKVDALTLGNEEKSNVDYVCKKYGLVNYQFEIKDIEKYIDDMVLCYEQPFYSLSPNYLLYKEASKMGYKVILSGLGPDELLGGYWYHANDTVSPSDYYKNEAHVLFPEKQARKLFGNDYEVQYLWMPRLNYLDLIHYIKSHHLYRCDQFSTWFGMEGRFPYLDKRIIDICFSLNSDQRIGKKILKDIAKKYFKKSFINSRKKGFSVPMQILAKTVLKDFVYDSINDLKKRHIFEGISEITDHRQIFHLAMTEHWMKMFNL